MFSLFARQEATVTCQRAASLSENRAGTQAVQAKLVPANRLKVLKGKKFDCTKGIQQKWTATSPQLEVMQREDSQPQKLSNADFGIRINLDHLCAELVHFSSSFSR